MEEFEIVFRYVLSWAILTGTFVLFAGSCVATLATVALIIMDTFKSLKLRFNNKPNGQI